MCGRRPIGPEARFTMFSSTGSRWHADFSCGVRESSMALQAPARSDLKPYRAGPRMSLFGECLGEPWRDQSECICM